MARGRRRKMKAREWWNCVRHLLQFKLRSSFNNVVSDATRKTFILKMKRKKVVKKKTKENPFTACRLFFLFGVGPLHCTRKRMEKIVAANFFERLCHFGKRKRKLETFHASVFPPTHCTMWAKCSFCAKWITTLTIIMTFTAEYFN